MSKQNGGRKRRMGWKERDRRFRRYFLAVKYRKLAGREMSSDERVRLLISKKI